SGEVLRNWDQIKEAERRAKGRRAERAAPSALDGIPRSLPALARAALAQDRADRLAPPDPRRPPAPFAPAPDRAPAPPPDQHRAADDDAAWRGDLGAALFALAGLARARGLDPEDALSTALADFTARFKALEARLRAKGRDWPSLTPEESDALWTDAALD